MSQKDFFDLQHDIRTCGLDMTTEATGFHAVFCPVCNKSNKRTGGFKFEEDGIIYNCFRGSCDSSCVFKLGEPVSRKFKDLMTLIGVTIPVSLRMAKSRIQRQLEEELDEDLYKKHEFKKIPNLTESMKVLQDDETPLGAWWRDYFERRSLSCSGIKTIHSGQYKDCVQIPFYFDGNLIGMHILTKKGVYISINGGNEHLFYTPSGRLSNDLVIVVEGTLDARSLPYCVGVLGNKIKPEQAWFLKGRNVIMLPDRSGGCKFSEQFHHYGWGLCIPPWKEKDLNSALIKYGALSVAKMIHDNVHKTKVSGQAAFKMWKENK